MIYLYKYNCIKDISKIYDIVFYEILISSDLKEVTTILRLPAKYSSPALEDISVPDCTVSPAHHEPPPHLPMKSWRFSSVLVCSPTLLLM